MVEVKLCSEPEVADLFGWLICDLPWGHKGPHRATVLWGDENHPHPGDAT